MIIGGIITIPAAFIWWIIRQMSIYITSVNKINECAEQIIEHVGEIIENDKEFVDRASDTLKNIEEIRKLYLKELEIIRSTT